MILNAIMVSRKDFISITVLRKNKKLVSMIMTSTLMTKDSKFAILLCIKNL